MRKKKRAKRCLKITFKKQRGLIKETNVLV
jgi:hypothetical protein